MYSYDMLLLAMFTWKRSTADVSGEGLDLHRSASIALPERRLQTLF